MRTAGIVLCGGKSRRMGLAKATLPFGPELMLHRVLRLLADVVEPIVVVAAPNQQLPGLPPRIIVARDQREGRGPLEGLHAGLTAIKDHADAAYATSCDVPLLVTAFVKRMICLLAEHDIAVPFDGQHYHPLASVYRTTVVTTIAKLLQQERLRPLFLYDEVATRRVSPVELCDVDPQLSTLKNVNQPRDYFLALQLAGFEPTPEILAQLNL